jgi:hypothetical protein
MLTDLSASYDRLIITAASAAYGPSLLALLGSLTLNWPQHPPVRVYDIGLDAATLAVLQANDIEVVPVPPFCPHWRQHFTWKIWCISDAPAHDVLWIDAGVAILNPLDEIFDALAHQGYFLISNYQLLDWEASEAACRGCGVPPEFRLGKPTLAGTMMGFNKQGRMRPILQAALAVAQTEEYIAATDHRHRHDQAIISLLLYKHLVSVVMADKNLYLAPQSPHRVYGQKVWVHRRKMRAEDVRHFTAHISTPGDAYRPQPPLPTQGWRYRLRRLREIITRSLTGDPRTLPVRLKRFITYNVLDKVRLKPSSPPRIYNGVRE